MEVIYIDSLFFLNLAIDYILLLTAAQVCGARLKRLRYLAAALVGAAYAVLVYLPRLGFLRLAPMVLIAAGLMSLIAFGGERRMLRCFVVFIAVAAAFGGFIWALSLAGLHPAFDVRTLMLSFALCYALLRLVFSGKLKLADTPRAEVELTANGQSVKFLALVDT
ncbi:MAG: sigma-E processing peptidase SpoIIGA, partial [Oscillospiraceae bacterium]|nr:sigma-E processing peptidase SpoIIGA [Oscillospiraceae bacterium]